MAKTIHLDYCGMAASGATVREAKQEAARKLTSLVSDLTRHSPEIVTCGAFSALGLPRRLRLAVSADHR